MVDGDKLQFIDFDDGGFGYRLFDIATVLLPNLDEQDYSSIQTEILDGYRSIRELDTDPLDLFMFLRSATYVGWIIDRMAEDGAAKRNHRFVTRARLLAERFLDNRS